MGYSFIGVLASISLLAGCLNNTSEQSRQEEGKEAEVAITRPCKTLIVVGDDRSGSATEIRRLDSLDYKKVMQAICDNGGGAFACVIIGNPSPQNKQSFRTTFNLPLPHKQKVKGATLSQDEAVMLENKQIDIDNQQIKAENAAKVQEFTRVISEKVIQYQPDKKDLTDIDDALYHINTILNEPTYADYDNIIVALFCDGINQPRGSKIEPITQKLGSQKDFQLYTIGWKDPSIFTGVKNMASFDSKEGFIETVRKISCR